MLWSQFYRHQKCCFLCLFLFHALFRLFRGRRGAIVGKLSPSQLPVDISGDAGDRDTQHIEYFSVHSVHSSPILKVRIHKEYHSVCPSSELGLSQALSRQRVCPSPQNRVGGGHTCLRVRGWGSPNSDDWRKGLALCLLSDS